MRTVSYDAQSGIITTVCTGISDSSDPAYLAALEQAMLRSRARNGCVLHFVDHRAAVVQTQFGSQHLATPQPGRQSCDRTAVLMKPGSANLSLSHGSPNGDIRFFGDQAEARRWLEEGRRPGSPA